MEPLASQCKKLPTRYHNRNFPPRAFFFTIPSINILRSSLSRNRRSIVTSAEKILRGKSIRTNVNHGLRSPSSACFSMGKVTICFPLNSCTCTSSTNAPWRGMRLTTCLPSPKTVRNTIVCLRPLSVDPLHVAGMLNNWMCFSGGSSRKRKRLISTRKSSSKLELSWCRDLHRASNTIATRPGRDT